MNLFILLNEHRYYRVINQIKNRRYLGTEDRWRNYKLAYYVLSIRSMVYVEQLERFRNPWLGRGKGDKSQDFFIGISSFFYREKKLENKDRFSWRLRIEKSDSLFIRKFKVPRTIFQHCHLFTFIYVSMKKSLIVYYQVSSSIKEKPDKLERKFKKKSWGFFMLFCSQCLNPRVFINMVYLSKACLS